MLSAWKNLPAAPDSMCPYMQYAMRLYATFVKRGIINAEMFFYIVTMSEATKASATPATLTVKPAPLFFLPELLETLKPPEMLLLSPTLPCTQPWLLFQDHPLKCTTAAITPAPAGIGMPTKYFRPGRPGLRRAAVGSVVP